MFRLHCKWDYRLLARSFHKAVDYCPRFLQNDLPEAEVSKLNNDFRVISENWRSEICTVGLWMDIGSRCETDTNNGVAHFLEHMYFKGTNSRDHKTIQMETLERNASWNAYTSREMIALYANCHKKDIEWAVSLLGEIVATNKYDDNLVERSKENILKEMEAVGNNPREVVFDYIHATAYQGTPLGRSILGTEEIVKKITAKDLCNFTSNFFKAPRMVLAATGDIDHNNLHNLANKHFGNVTCNYENGIDQKLPYRYTGSDLRHRDDDLPLAHIIIAFEGPGWSHQDSIPLLLASLMTGSYDHSYGGTVYTSNQWAIKAFTERTMHSFNNFLISYHDTSLWGMYYTGIDSEILHLNPGNINRMIRLCSNISEFEVNRAKSCLKNKLIMSLNDSNSICDEIARHLIVYGRRISLDEMFTRIDIVNAATIREVVNSYIYDKCPVVAGYGPIEGLLDYNNIRRSTTWLRY